MATEIERKFLVKSDEYKKLGTPVLYRQGYISNDPEFIKRIRIAGDIAYVTIKSSTTGITRSEFEQETPMDEAKAILESMNAKMIVEKYRYKIEYEGKIWEVDEFIGDNEGLVVAEIELNTEEESFKKPSWVGKEVSYDSKYYNINLSILPYNKWKK